MKKINWTELAMKLVVYIFEFTIVFSVVYLTWLGAELVFNDNATLGGVDTFVAMYVAYSLLKAARRIFPGAKLI